MCGPGRTGGRRRQGRLGRVRVKAQRVEKIRAGTRGGRVWHRLLCLARLYLALFWHRRFFFLRILLLDTRPLRRARRAKERVQRRLPWWHNDAHGRPRASTMALLVEKHVAFVKKLEQKRDQSLAYHMTAHLRMNGVYWGVCALALMRAGDALDKDALVEFVLSCFDEASGGFGAYPQHDAHILSTLSAVQILALKDALPALGARRDRVIECTLSISRSCPRPAAPQRLVPGRPLGRNGYALPLLRRECARAPRRARPPRQGAHDHVDYEVRQL